MDIMQLTAAHNTAALRFAFMLSLLDGKDEATAGDQENRDRASAAEREALQAIIEHVPVSVYDLNIKARYLLGRIKMGDEFPAEQTPALLRSLIQFYP